LEVQALGQDEDEAIRAAEAFFQGGDEDRAQQFRVGIEQSPDSGPESGLAKR